LKKRAVAAVIKGIAPGRVAEAAGVSEPSIRNWCKRLKVKIEAPTELKLIDEKSPSADHQTAIIHFQSGLRIEIPVSALTPELVRTFQGVQP
jgi:transposase